VLELRSQELAAGLDAWTVGWFSDQVRAPGEKPRQAGGDALFSADGSDTPEAS
jgi:hypothetical protein